MNRAQRRAQERQDATASRARRIAALGSGAVLAIGTGGMAVSLAAGSASAAVSDTVTNLNDSGAGSLRAALEDANANGGGTITFDAALSGSIVLESDLPHLTEDVQVTGPASHAVTIDANGFGAFYIEFNQLTISNLTISGSNRPGIATYGGDIQADAMTISGNTNNDSRGGGIRCENGEESGLPTVVVTNSVISGNTTDGGGGGLYLNFCDTTIVSTTIADNNATNGTDGGGLYTNGGSLVIENSTISGNYAEDNSAGVYLDEGITATISNTTIANNTTNNTDDGGVAISVASGSTLDLIQSTVTGNHHVGGAASELYGALYLQSGSDSVDSVGAGAQSNGGNDAPAKPSPHPSDEGVRAQGAGEVNIVGTIISGNGGLDVFSNGRPGEVFSDHSLIGTVQESVTVNDLGGTIRSTTPGLGALANNGGPTQTMALVEGSPAIDAGPVPVPAFPLNDNDQRGAGFPREVNGRVDIGAFEVQPPAPIDIAPRFTG